MLKINCKEIVKELLTNKPHLRDDDHKLMSNIWLRELGGMPAATNLSSFEFLNLFSQNRLTSPESIRRCRQKIQELYPELRGTSYNERHKQAEKFKQLIKNF